MAVSLYCKTSKKMYEKHILFIYSVIADRQSMFYECCLSRIIRYGFIKGSLRIDFVLFFCYNILDFL